MSLYEELNLPKVINASATLTKLGGSLMPQSVVATMVEASKSFIPLDEMHIAVGKRIAELTRNEAAYVSSGAAAGITLSVSACISGTDPVKIAGFPYLENADKNEVIIVRTQRNGYDYAARQTGARIVEIDPTLEALEAALNPRTACVLWFAGKLSDGSPAIEDAIAVSHEHGVPFVVDAAAQIPPASNLWHFTRELGVDLVIFSGGKGIRGPQSSGLILGRADLIEACRLNGSPNPSIGRPMKVGKEELAGALAAVNDTLNQDETELIAGYETVVHGWIEDLSRLKGISAERTFPSEAGQPMPRALIRFLEGGTERRDAVIASLREGPVRVEVATESTVPDGIFLNPQTLEPGDEEIVAQRLKAAIEDLNW
ncbi:DgaE family pyridoxal phosphate-dependent ammonia lyase [soil metagenome]